VTARFASVVFDCDSTLAAIEGIDELAGPHRAEIAGLTDAAMRGEVALEQIYGRRLELIRPSRAAVERLAVRYVDALVPDARETVAALQAAGVAVYVVSGGLLPPVLAVSRALGIADANVAAVAVHFDADGEFAGFDRRSPLARQDGKRIVIEQWTPPVVRPSLLIGDGATDLEARPAVDRFVAYAGVTARRNVLAAADLVLYDPSLAPVAALVLATAPAPAFRSLLERGRALLDQTDSSFLRAP
jgi:phosphoserine phosphatase